MLSNKTLCIIPPQRNPIHTPDGLFKQREDTKCMEIKDTTKDKKFMCFLNRKLLLIEDNIDKIRWNGKKKMEWV
jgi:hypothetical protein